MKASIATGTDVQWQAVAAAEVAMNLLPPPPKGMGDQVITISLSVPPPLSCLQPREDRRVSPPPQFLRYAPEIRIREPLFIPLLPHTMHD